MKKILFSLSLLSFFAGAACKKSADSKITDTPVNEVTATSNAVVVPLGGNAFITQKAANANEVITANGLGNWNSPESVISVYFRVENPGTMAISLRMKVPAGSSTFKVSLGNNQSRTKTTANVAYDTVSVGNFEVLTKGYIKIDIQGVSKTGNYFGDISDLIIKGQPVTNTTYFVRDNIDNRFYWGRRGPSVHLNYKVPDAAKNNVAYFYNEITVPTGMDAVGSYFMANGFAEGYFGIQVNSASERKILFSVWSPFHTDNPANIPDDKKIKLLKKGAGVTTGEFGDEGSGGQSYLVYPWVAGKTYAFLTQAQPDSAANKTTYTSWFKPEGGSWLLIASFQRPATTTRLRGLSSFLENFLDDMGSSVRSANYGNQWIVEPNGNWTQLTEALFTGDDIANRNYRKDVAGGAAGNQFYLKNGGFFSDFVPLNQSFGRQAVTNAHPIIELTTLP